MKKKYLLLLLITFAGCKKSNNNPNSSVLITNSSFTGAGSINSVYSAWIYKYDNNKRLTDIILESISGNMDIPLIYNAQGLLVSYGTSGPNQNYVLLTYDSNGNLISGSQKRYDPSGQVQNSYNFNFTLTNGQVSQIKVYDLLSSNPLSLAFSYNNSYDSNNNLIKRVQLNSTGAVIETNNYTFGTHHSPQINNHLKYNISPLLDNFINDDDDYYNTNERLTDQWVFGNDTVNYQFSYTYNNQYPLSAFVSDETPVGLFAYKYSGL